MKLDGDFVYIIAMLMVQAFDWKIRAKHWQKLLKIKIVDAETSARSAQY